MSRKASIIFLFALGMLFSTGAAYAQTTSGLVSCNSAAEGAGSAGCNLCTLVSTGQNVINFAIMVAFPISALLFGWAGFLYMTSAYSVSQIGTAHKIFKATAIGFACVLAGWIIVDAVIHQVILNNYSTYFKDVGGNWYTVPPCTASRPTDRLVSQLLSGLFAPNNPNNSPIITPSGSPNGAVTCPPNSVQAGSGCADTTNQRFVMPVGYSCDSGTTFDPSSGGCIDQTTGFLVSAPRGGSSTGTIIDNGATYTQDAAKQAIGSYNDGAGSNSVSYYSTVSFDKVNAALVQDVLTQTQSASAGKVTITSANDSTHSESSEHYAGTAVDVGGGSGNSANPTFDAYIRGNWTRTTGFTSEAYKDPNGYIWNFEGNHWHVSKDGR